MRKFKETNGKKHPKPWDFEQDRDAYCRPVASYSIYDANGEFVKRVYSVSEASSLCR